MTGPETNPETDPTPDPKTDVERAVREFLRSEHEGTVSALLRCADTVAEGWADDSTTDRSAVVGPLKRALRESGLLARFPDILAGAAGAAGFSLRATPVPAPPYVAVTSRGPVLRATVSGGRLVVSFRLFDVVRDGGVRYVRGTSDARTAVSVEYK
ncbi:hypothetical protein [Haladaptatus sp.]|uniref:hypothetical protein n=1 Tax=Haladaptatus sp. TaxID=1973141 RepID=UPI003C4957B8